MYVWAIDKSAAASNYHCKIKSNGWLARSLAVSQSIFQIAMPWPLSFQYVYVCAKRAQKVQIQEKEISVSDRNYQRRRQTKSRNWDM